jgi:hypothetical protein
MTKKIAKIESTFLGTEDHGIYTFYLTLNYGGSVQAAGGYALDDVHHTEKKNEWGHDEIIRLGTEEGMRSVIACIEVCGVDCWERIKGRTVMALIENDRVVGLEPLPTESGKPFLFADIFKRE